MYGKTLSGRTLDPDLVTTEPSSYQVAILMGLQDMQLYQGTVPAHVKARRRARGKLAKAARKANR